MSASRRACERGALACALALLFAPARAQDSVREPFEAGRYPEALEAASALEDPASRAEWRFHVLYTAGDLPGALDAALEGLAHQPRHPALLQNATSCALELGSTGLALSLAGRLAQAARAPETSARAEDLLRRARTLAERRRAAERARARAKGVALVGIALSLAGLAWLARGAGR